MSRTNYKALGLTKPERARLAVARSYFKKHGIIVEPARVQLLWVVLNTCRSALRLIRPQERAALLKFLNRNYK